MKPVAWGIIVLFNLCTLGAQDFVPDNWNYIAIDSNKQKWGDWDEPDPVSISDINYEGRTHFRIETEDIIWYYDKAGGGFSRMIDRAGNDWISFRMDPWGKYPESSASSFRGLPNLVFGGEDDGAVLGDAFGVVDAPAEVEAVENAEEAPQFVF